MPTNFRHQKNVFIFCFIFSFYWLIGCVSRNDDLFYVLFLQKKICVRVCRGTCCHLLPHKWCLNVTKTRNYKPVVRKEEEKNDINGYYANIFDSSKICHCVFSSYNLEIDFICAVCYDISRILTCKECEWWQYTTYTPKCEIPTWQFSCQANQNISQQYGIVIEMALFF